MYVRWIYLYRGISIQVVCPYSKMSIRGRGKSRLLTHRVFGEVLGVAQMVQILNITNLLLCVIGEEIQKLFDSRCGDPRFAQKYSKL